MKKTDHINTRASLDSYFGHFWTSNDFAVANNLVIPSNMMLPVEISLQKESFNNIHWLTQNLFDHLEISMRSCFSQAGIYIVGNISDYIKPNHIEILNRRWHVTFKVLVANRWLSSIRLQKWTPLFRLFFRPSHGALTGRDLYETIANGHIKIDWVYGQTRTLSSPSPSLTEWSPHIIEHLAWWEMSNDLAIAEVEEAKTLKIFLENTVHIPWSDQQEEIIITWKQDLTKILIPFDSNRVKHRQQFFGVWETPTVEFGNFFGVIANKRYWSQEPHVSSPLIDPWFSWQLRPEVMRDEDIFHPEIELRIYPNGE